MFCVSWLQDLACSKQSPLSFSPFYRSITMSWFFVSFLQMPLLPVPPAILPPLPPTRWLGVPWLHSIFLSSSRKIQYLSQSVWVHSPLSLGVLPVALRWISPGLIDIALAMKYAYHDQRWWQERRHLYKSTQPGADGLLEAKFLWILFCKAQILKINHIHTQRYSRMEWNLMALIIYNRTQQGISSIFF